MDWSTVLFGLIIIMVTVGLIVLMIFVSKRNNDLNIYDENQNGNGDLASKSEMLNKNNRKQQGNDPHNF